MKNITFGLIIFAAANFSLAEPLPKCAPTDTLLVTNYYEETIKQLLDGIPTQAERDAAEPRLRAYATRSKLSSDRDGANAIRRAIKAGELSEFCSLDQS